VTYGFNVQDIRTLSDAAAASFSYMYFQGVGGPNPLSGIRTSQIIPSYSYNTVNHPDHAHRGKRLFVTMNFAGSFWAAT
jgi:outer membrane protein insertion porin family